MAKTGAFLAAGVRCVVSRTLAFSALHADTLTLVQRVRDLPNDVESLKRLVLEQQAALDSHELEIERLRIQLARLRRLKFGRSSEALDTQITQLELTLEELESRQAAAPVITSSEAEPTQPVRRPLPEHLPRESIVHEPRSNSDDCMCPACGGVLRSFGEDVSEILEYVPSRFKVIRHVRPKFSCIDCEQVVQAPAPSRPIERGIAGPAMLAHVLVSKFCDHLPLYRQSQIYAREGLDLDRSTLADWVGGASRLLDPLVEKIEEHVMAAKKLHADDTPIPVLSPGNGKTKTARLWVYVRDDRPSANTEPAAVLFRYSPDRKAAHTWEHLRSFHGVLQADGYAGFDALYERPQQPLREAACWAHVRRKLYDIHIADASPIAKEAIERIALLYQIEEEIRGRPTEERKIVRQARAGPILADLHAWMIEQSRKLSRKSELAVAIRYALSRWAALTRYRDDGTIEIDNNTAERALRAVALGRKNYLFAGSDAGGERAAAIYTLIGTAKLHGLDPQAYLKHVLSHIAEHPSSQIEALLPWNVATVLKRAEQLAA